MWMVVGLGNPGAKYAGNRHNIGFHVVEELARRHQFPAFRKGNFGGDATTGTITTKRGPEKTILLKPMEFMNLSGYAVQRATSFHHITMDKLVVVHDEIDLDFGVLRVKVAGGHGGHNGIRSLVDQLGNSDFLRVRVGVGKPGPRPIQLQRNQPVADSEAGGGDKNVAGWVLSDFPSAQKGEVDALVGRAASAVESILGEGPTVAMNEFNRSDSRGKTRSA